MNYRTDREEAYILYSVSSKTPFQLDFPVKHCYGRNLFRALSKVISTKVLKKLLEQGC